MKDNRTKISNKSVLILLIVCIMCLGFIFFNRHINSNNDDLWAIITIDGEIVSSRNLTKSQDDTFTINGITFEIKDNKIRFLKNDCKNQVCVNTGYISELGDIAVCLPKKTSIEIKDYYIK